MRKVPAERHLSLLICCLGLSQNYLKHMGPAVKGIEGSQVSSDRKLGRMARTQHSGAVLCPSRRIFKKNQAS